MKPELITAGAIVINEGAPAWGIGKVLLVDPSHVWVYFKDIEGAPKDAVKQLSVSANRLSLAEIQSDVALDNLPPMVRDGKIHAPERFRLTEQQAIHTFVRRYRSFEDSNYKRDERNYKDAAHQEALTLLNDGNGRSMLSSSRYSELVPTLKRVIQKAGLLGVQETIALNDAFKDYAAAAKYAKAILDFIDVPDATQFNELVEATGSLPAEIGKAKVLTWPTVTLFPFLASPANAMFLKPDMTRRIADAFSFDIHYSPSPNWNTYCRLLELSHALLDRLRPLGAKDLIDVQSFMWIVAGDPYRKVPDSVSTKPK